MKTDMDIIERAQELASKIVLGIHQNRPNENPDALASEQFPFLPRQFFGKPEVVAATPGALSVLCSEATVKHLEGLLKKRTVESLKAVLGIMENLERAAFDFSVTEEALEAKNRWEGG